MHEIKEKRIAAGLSRAEMARRFEIPIRTLEDWETEKRTPPVWAGKLIIEKLEQIANDKIIGGKAMKKYELKKCSREIIGLENIYAGCTVDSDNYDPEILKSFLEKEDALETLKEYKTNIQKLSSSYRVTEYYVEEAEYDEDNEWISGGDIWEFSNLIIELIDKESNETIGTFDNGSDAKDMQNRCETESFISYS